MQKTLLIMVLLVFLASCKGNYKQGIVLNDTSQGYSDNYNLEWVSKKEFPLDSISIAGVEYMQLVKIDDEEKLTFLNTYSNAIYFYDVNKSVLEKIVAFEKNIPKIQGYNYINDDSIFVYSYGRSTLYIVDNTSKILYETAMYHQPSSTEGSILPAPYLQTATPLTLYENKILSIGFVAGESDMELTTDRPVVAMLDIATQTLHHDINYPIQYQKYNWDGGLTYRLPYYVLVNGVMVISFSAHHNLITYDILTGQQKEYYAGSHFIPQIHSYPASKLNRHRSIDGWQWYMETPSYEGIFYDRYRDIYYRIARLPVIEYDADTKYNNKPVVVIILDSNLNYIGEQALPTDIVFNSMNSFVSEDGFHIQVLTEDEDNMLFYQYKVVQDEE
jgi:hypothetical protein